ncbi:amino acid ABC transporter permease [Thermofilum pendens]|uniref:Polar amino acid ABC transporter, inner membrane subunit n=1 Tax=Thermofilum pendens (strain DSM 2475 / Hrk 5) TaxID=368408 RepID=A1RYM6_THEPD|nr:amino acid ABC transporter permease [Thermofilum pendens]ABL78306.1 polar amino acid ABC transporter, inner membrane subunit [Thermofilum pendens Hrk 5]
MGLLDFVYEYTPFIAEGVVVTLQISVISFLLGLALGIALLGLSLTSLRPLARMYIEPVRGTPLLVQLLLIYFGLPSIGIKLDAFTSSFLALGLNSAAYQAEIFRSALKSIPDVQILSAESLGFSGSQVYRYVILPQALRISIPSLVNEFVTVVKESSLASVIGIVELTRRGEYVAAYTYRALESYLVVAAIYFAVCYLISYLSRRIEEKIRIPGYTGA